MPAPRTISNIDDDRIEIFNFLRASDLYNDPQAKEDIDTLIEYLSETIEKGSANALLGGIRMQNGVLDELPWLAGEPSMYPNPPLKEAISRLHEIRLQYDTYIKAVSDILNYGIEKYAMDSDQDFADQYYVQIDEREYSVDPYISKKPLTLEEMNRVACHDTGMYMVQSVWHELYGDDYFGLYFFREQVGFDHVKFNIKIKSIDVNKLKEAAKKYKGQTYNDLPRIIIEYTDPDDPNDFPVSLPLPLSENHFKKIEITLSHHVTFLVQKNNSPLKDGERKKSDIYLLKTTVEPHPDYAFLGNIDNYSYIEMTTTVHDAIYELYDLTGIKVDYDKVKLNDVELNLTFRQECDFNDLMRSISYYQLYTRKGYVTREFRASDDLTISYGGHSSRSIREKYTRMKVTGYTTSSKSIIIKLYDKAAETIAYAESLGYTLKIEGNAIVRLEFEIRNPDQLKRYFNTGDEPVYLKNLSQEKIESVYKNLAAKFFRIPYEGRPGKAHDHCYVTDSLTTLKNIVSTLDTTSKGGKWKVELVKAILSEEIFKKASPALLKEDDLSDVMKYNHTFARKPKQYKKIIHELLQESDNYKKGQEHAYDMLYNFLNKACNLKTLSPYRWMGFAVATPENELPDISDDEIEKSLSERKLWIELKDAQ